MSDYPNMVWEMYATAPDGEVIYCGNCDYERGAELLLEELKRRGYIATAKLQVMRGNAGQTLARRLQ